MTFLIFLCDVTKYFFYKIVILVSLVLIIPNKSKSSLKLSSADAVEGCGDGEFASLSICELLQLQERMFKNFMEYIAGSLRGSAILWVKLLTLKQVLNSAKRYFENTKYRLICSIRIYNRRVRRSLRSKHLA